MPKPKRVRRRHYIRQWREYRNLSQAQVAERLGISQTNYGRIERGLVPYNQDILEQLADSLLCSVADLLMRNPADKNAIWSIHDQLAKAPEREQARILSAVKALTGTDG